MRQWFSQPFSDDDAWGHGISRRDDRHDGAVGDAQSFDAVHAQLAVHDCRASWPIACGSVRFLLSAAVAGFGIARLSETLIRDTIASGALVEILRHYRCVYSDGESPAVWIVHPHRSPLRRTRTFSEALASHLMKGSPEELVDLVGRLPR